MMVPTHQGGGLTYIVRSMYQLHLLGDQDDGSLLACQHPVDTVLENVHGDLVV